MGVPQRDWKGEVEDLCLAAKWIKDVGPENEGQVADLGSTITSLTKEIEAERNIEVGPHRQKVLDINERYKALTNALGGALDHLKARVADWKLKQIKAQQAEEKRIGVEERQHQAAAAEALLTGDVPPELPPIREVAPPPPANVSRGSFGKSVGRKNWKAECTDKKKLCRAIIDGVLPEELLEFQTQKAVSLARGGVKFDPEEVGIRAWQQSDQSFS